MNAVSDSNTIEVDTRGLRCPLPVIRLAQAARDAQPGTRIVVLASDPAARYDIPAWCRMCEHELGEITEVAATPENKPENADPPGPPAAGSPAQRPSRPYLRLVILLRA